MAYDLSYQVNHVLDADETTGMIRCPVPSSVSGIMVRLKIKQQFPIGNGGDFGNIVKAGAKIEVYDDDASYKLLEETKHTPKAYNIIVNPSGETFEYPQDIYIKVTALSGKQHTYVCANYRFLDAGVNTPQPRDMACHGAPSGWGTPPMPGNCKGVYPAPESEDSFKTAYLYGHQSGVVRFCAASGSYGVGKHAPAFSVPSGYDRVHITTDDGTKIYMTSRHPTSPPAVFAWNTSTNTLESLGIPDYSATQIHMCVYIPNSGLYVAPVLAGEGYKPIYKYNTGTNSWNLVGSGWAPANDGSWWYSGIAHSGHIWWTAPNADALYDWDAGQAERYHVENSYQYDVANIWSMYNNIYACGIDWLMWNPGSGDYDFITLSADGNINFNCGEHKEGRPQQLYFFKMYAIDSMCDIYRIKGVDITLEGNISYDRGNDTDVYEQLVPDEAIGREYCVPVGLAQLKAADNYVRLYAFDKYGWQKKRSWSMTDIF
jgi:hypothetical protein